MKDRSRTIEYYEKRFGITAVEMGFITSEELIEALRVQVMEDMRQEPHRLIGEILLDQDKMTASQVEHVVKTMLNE